MTRIPEGLALIDRVRSGVDAYLDHITRHAHAFVALMRGGIGSDPEVTAVIESVRTQLFDKLLSGSAFRELLRGDARFETVVRGWIGFVEGVSIDWCANPRLSRTELRELMIAVLFEAMHVVAAAAIASP